MVVWLHKQRGEIQAAAYLSLLSYRAAAVNSRGNESLLWKVRKQHHLKEILVSQNSVDWWYDVSGPFFPRMGLLEERGFMLD